MNVNTAFRGSPSKTTRARVVFFLDPYVGEVTVYVPRPLNRTFNHRGRPWMPGECDGACRVFSCHGGRTSEPHTAGRKVTVP